MEDNITISSLHLSFDTITLTALLTALFLSFFLACWVAVLRHKVRFDSATEVSSMVKYVEFSNVFKSSQQEYLIFIADNTLVVQASSNGSGSVASTTSKLGGGGLKVKGTMTILLNRVPVEIATVFFNEAISFVPCFKYKNAPAPVFCSFVSLPSLACAYLLLLGGVLRLSCCNNPIAQTELSYTTKA